MTAKTSADLLTLAPGTSFEGTFRVHSIDVTLAQEQCPRLWLQMGDATGDIDARLVLDRHSASLNRGYYHVAGVIQRLKNGTAYADLTQVDLATDDDLLGGPALLPLRFCPPPGCAALKGWISLHQSLPTALQRFTAALTLDRDRDLALLQDAFSAPGYQRPGGRLLLAHHRQAALFFCAAVTRPPKELTDIRVTRLGCVLHALNLVASSFRSPNGRTPMGSDRGKFAGALARLQSDDPRAAQWLVSLFGDLDRPADWP